MKLTEIKCQYCGATAIKKMSNAKFCSERCRKNYWTKFTEPRAVCIDCGTLLGQSSLRNIRNGNQHGRCQSCATLYRIGVGTF